MLETKQVSFLFCKTWCPSPFSTQRSWTLLSIGQICEDCWGSTVLICRSVQSVLDCPPIKDTKVSDLICTRPLMIRFIGQTIVCLWEVLVVEPEPEPVEIILHSSTINWVGHIFWMLGPARKETGSS